MPAPMMAPTPMAVMLNGPSTLGRDLKALPSIAMISAIGLRAKTPLWSIPFSPQPSSPDCGCRAIAIVADMRPMPAGLHDICHATPCAASRSLGVHNPPAKEDDHDPHDAGDPRPDRRG